MTIFKIKDIFTLEVNREERRNFKENTGKRTADRDVPKENENF